MLSGYVHLWKIIMLQTIETVRQQLQTAEGTTKVDLLNTLSGLWRNVNLAESYQSASEALALAQQSAYTTGIMDAHNNLGVFYWSKSDYNRALEHFQRAAELALPLNDTYRLGLAWHNVGEMYRYQSNYDLAFEYHNKALHLFTQIRQVV